MKEGERFKVDLDDGNFCILIEENIEIDFGVKGITAIPLWPPACPKCGKFAIFQMFASDIVFCYNCGAEFEIEFKEIKK